MNVASPQLPLEPAKVQDLESCLKAVLAEEEALQNTSCSGSQLLAANFDRLELLACLLESCVLRGCSLAKSSFVDVLFQDCDLSNCNLEGAYFQRCRFVRCKLVGTDFEDAVLKNCSFQDCTLAYSTFDRSSLTAFELQNCDLTEASFSTVKQKQFIAKNSSFCKTNFFQTPLCGIDFTGNQLTAPLLSSPPAELRGSVIDMFQAAELIGLLGVVVKN
ncbi:MAG: pentapeptide repeat-containing protein [Angelakisella sp.]|nr:pentapeptide repeat-containing protein [Angelakisella sp.]